MQSYCINSLLSKLVALTQERDESTLEIALIRTLNDFNATMHGGKVKSASIYHLTDDKEQHLSTFTLDDSNNAIELEAPISETLKQSIIDCFKRVNHFPLNTDTSNTKLYPITNIAEQVISVIGIDASLSNMHLDISIRMLLEIYKNYASLLNDNESDTLTGLLNRKTFEYKINKTLVQMQSTSKRKEDKTHLTYFLAIFDIDHFKRVNDQFGHLIGDEVLLMFSQLMRQSFRETDQLFRFGGEEFVGVFECNNTEDIKNMLERFRVKVAQFQFPQIGKVTVSAGYTQISDFDTSSQIIDRADSALYFAKNNGRDRITFYEQLIANGLLQESKKEGDIEFF